MLRKRRVKKTPEAKPIDYLPAQLDINHLEDNGMLFTNKEMKKIIKEFEKNPQENRLNFYFKHAKGDYLKAAVMKLDGESKDDPPQYFAIYQGEKKGKLLGSGGSGKVKIMEKLPEGPRYALKISMGTSQQELDNLKREVDNLKQAGLSPGGFLREGVNNKLPHWLIAMELAPGTNVLKQLVKPRQVHLNIPRGEYTLEPNSLYLDIKDAEPICRVLVENEEGKREIKEISLAEINNNDKAKLMNMISAIKAQKSAPVFDHELRENIFKILRKAGHFEFITKNADLNQLASVGKGMVDAVSDLHDKGLIHNDLKPEQFIADPKTYGVKLVDLGTATSKKQKKINVQQGLSFVYEPPEFHLKMNEKRPERQESLKDAFLEIQENKDFSSFLSKHNIDTYPQFISLNGAIKDYPKGETKNLLQTHDIQPSEFEQFKKIYKEYDLREKELFSKKRKESFEVDNSIKADVYMLGISLGQLYNLTKHTDLITHFKLDLDLKKYNLSAFQPGGKHYDIYAIKSAEEFRENPMSDNPENMEKLERLRQFLEKMTALDPKDRPDMEEVKRFMDEFAKEFPPPKPLPMVLLEVNHFLKLSEEERKNLAKELENTQVVMVAKTKNTKKEIYTLQKFLQDNGIALHEDYYEQKKVNLEIVKQEVLKQTPDISAFIMPIESKVLSLHKEELSRLLIQQTQVRHDEVKEMINQPSITLPPLPPKKIKKPAQKTEESKALPLQREELNRSIEHEVKPMVNQPTIIELPPLPSHSSKVKKPVEKEEPLAESVSSRKNTAFLLKKMTVTKKPTQKVTNINVESYETDKNKKAVYKLKTGTFYQKNKQRIEVPMPGPEDKKYRK